MKRSLSFYFCAALALAQPTAALALENELYKPPMPVLPDDYWPRLNQGEVVVMQQIIDDADDRSYVDLVELILIDAPVAETFKIIEDCSGFDEYQPNVDLVTLLDGAGDEEKVMAKLWKFELSAFILDVVYHVITLNDRNNAVVEFELDATRKNDIKTSKGHWWLYPVEGGDKTLIVYALIAESGFPVPRFIEEYATQISLRDILINTRHRVHSGGTWKRGDDPPTHSVFGKSRIGSGSAP